VFHTIDTTNSGFISADDLQRAMSQVGLMKAASEIARLVQAITHSDEGKINYSDFILATISLKTKLSE
jgi:Ca2+-binding EF-hand superfamily protein